MVAPNLYHSILVSLLWASVWFSSLARADYNRLCPNKEGQIQVDSTFYTVTCDTSYISPAPKKVKEGVSAEDCARLCTAQPACRAMVWHLGNCWQSDKTDAVSFRVPGAVLLTPGEKKDPVTEPSPGQQKCLEEKELLAQEKELLAKEKELLAQEKEQCGKNLAQCEAEKSSISAAKATCEKNLAAANKDVGQRVPDDFVPSRVDDGREVIIAGKKWKIYYAKCISPISRSSATLIGL
ncbi:hypothetical protein Asppvi_001644 [Aspergillus pseudoviridinutans]|uniref:Apple domain-containing protein n=1 Tax=Aspergillus pseudoviridinutans TaxID=1517512 RepID=A0A9P3ERY1_9EURO|nr:uncharacterized protein Asppvi_001644 [Aspergillus pseudoviridinutans]GIJ83125.1 hypothetical protein Asppvi_001644 [Aspergillus pseudoviridinutans]